MMFQVADMDTGCATFKILAQQPLASSILSLICTQYLEHHIQRETA